jgi:zinc transport system substrate-binding protein
MIHSIIKRAVVGSAWRRLPWAALVLGVFAALACARVASTPAIDGARLSVATTTYPLEYFARRVGGEAVSVINLVPPGVEAHDFEPSPADIRALREAHVVVYNGAGFEPWIGRALASGSNASRVVVNTAPPGGGAEHLQDPHTWLDPLLAMEQVNAVRDGLAKARPEQREVFLANAEALNGALFDLHQLFQRGLQECRHKLFVTSHAAFGHLAKRYGLEQVSIAGVTPEAEPSPGELAALADRLRTLGVRYLLVEPIIGQELSLSLAREIGADLLPIHPLESLTPEEVQGGETYFTIMQDNLRSLRTAMECS